LLDKYFKGAENVSIDVFDALVEKEELELLW
jgi:hypothetical protein